MKNALFNDRTFAHLSPHLNMASGSGSNAKLGRRVQLRWDQRTCGTIVVNIGGHNEEIGFRIDSGVFKREPIFCSGVFWKEQLSFPRFHV